MDKVQLNHVIKMFSTSFRFFHAGPLAYSFVHQNMPQALPSLRTVQCIVHNEYEVMHEREFRFVITLIVMNVLEL